MKLVLFILVYFVAAAWTEQIRRPLAGHKIEMTSTGNATQYVQFDNVSYNMTDFTVCTWIKLMNFTQAQTIFRLTGSKKETVFLWRLIAHPKQTIRVTIKGKRVASESAMLTKGQWNHICFQWKSSTGIWAMFVNVKIHSVGQITTSEGSDNTTAVSAWKLQGTGDGILGDDGAACRNRFQAYGLYMTGTAVQPAVSVPEGGNKSSGGDSATTATSGGGGKRRVVKRVRTDGAAPKNRRQAVYDDLDDPAGTAAPPSPFQWLGKAFAVMKRLFTFVIIPFFKFVRNTFFQTRTVDDTVVDVSETRFTISDVKFTQTLPDDLADSPSTSSSTATATIATTTTAAATANGVQRDDKQRSARQTDDERCTSADRGVTGDDLVSATVDDAVSPNAKRYLQMVSKSLSDIGVNAAFVRQTFMCCHQQLSSQANVINWDGAEAKLVNAIKSPAALGCGQF